MTNVDFRTPTNIILTIGEELNYDKLHYVLFYIVLHKSNSQFSSKI